MGLSKKIGLGALGVVVLAAIVIAFSYLGSELVRMMRTEPVEPRAEREASDDGRGEERTARGSRGDEQGRRDPERREPRRTGSGDPILVQVLDPRGRPVTGARVTLHASGHPPYDETYAEQTTDADGLATLATTGEDRYALVATSEPFVPITGTHVFPGDQVTVNLEEGGPLFGVVRDEMTGDPLEGVEVHGTTRDLEALRWNGLAVTDSEGRYRFDAVSARSLIVRFSRPGFEAHTVRDFFVSRSTGMDVSVDLVPGLTISGWVMDADTGDPIPGASISIGFGIFEREGEAETDERGMFEIRGVERGRLTVRARARGYVPGQVAADLRGRESETAVQIDLERWTTVSGIVRANSGEPVSGAEVFAEEKGFIFSRNAERLATTGQDGRFEASLEGLRGDVRLRATHDDYAPGRSSGFRVLPGQNIGDVEIVLPLGGRIAGAVHDDEGQAVGGAVVNLYEKPRQSVDNPAYKLQGPFQTRPRGRVTHSTRTERDGTFELRGIEPGDRILECRADGYLPALVNDLALGEGTEIGPLDIELTTGRAISGFVLDSSGGPIEGARVSAMRQGDIREGGNGSAMSGPDGSFRIDGLSPGNFSVFANRAGFVRADERDVSTGASALTLTLRKHGGLAGTVSFSGADVPAKFEARLHPLAADAARTSAVRKSFSSRNGQFRFESVAPGEYELVVEADGHRPSMVGPLRVSEDRVVEDLHVVLTAGGVVEGRVVTQNGDPVGGVEVFARVVGGASDGLGRVVGPVRSDRDGAFRMTGLDDGRVEVHATKESFTMVTPVLAYVRDGAATWVDLTVIRAGGVRLRVYDVDGNPVADARATLVPLGEAARFIDPKSLRLGTRYTGQPEALRRAVEQLSRTDATGFVGYAGVPPGDYRVELRHETLGASDLTLRVRSGEPELVEVTLDY